MPVNGNKVSGILKGVNIVGDGVDVFEDDPAFDQLETPAMVAGFIHRQYGDGALKQLLTGHSSTPIAKEWTLDIAAELSQAGLGKASAIAMECAAQQPSMTDVAAFCSYPDDKDNRANIEAWSRAEERRQREHELKRHKTRAKA